VISAVRPLLRGPTGRRAVIAAGMTGLLLAGVSVVEGTDTQSTQPAPPGTAVATAKLAAAGRLSGLESEVSVSRYAGALTTGMRLLAQAAAAGRAVTYQGLQVTSWLTPGGGESWLGREPIVSTLNVVHQTGQPPDGALGLTPTLVGLLGSHYTVLYTGPGSAAGRPASIVEVLRPYGGVAAMFWLDKATTLPLRRELFDGQAHVTGVCGFADLTVRTHATGVQRATTRGQRATTRGQRARAQEVPAPAPAEPGNVSRMIAHFSGDGTGPAADGSLPAPARPWADRLGAAQLAMLRARGWPAPAVMPGGLTLFDASESATATGRVIDLAYSDGLSVVSLFVQRGKLPAALSGWRQTDLSGHPLFLRNPAEPDLTWSADGYVYTVVATAPAATLAGVVDSLPHEARLGFWARMGRGVRRLLSWVDPFR
jgi:sigma-E factor negative regulatory protein RseB